MVEVSVHEVMSGVELDTVQPSAFTWKSSLAGNGTGSVTFQLSDSPDSLTGSDVVYLFEPNDRMVALRDGSHVPFVGVVAAWTYDRDASTVTVRLTELRQAIFPQRMTFGVNQYQNGNLTVTNRTLRGAARAVLARAMQWSSEWVLPIDLPADGTGTFSADWRRWETLKISDLLDQIEKAGCEIFFRPYLSGGGIRFESQVFTSVQNGTADIDVTAADSPVTGLTYTLDGTQQVTGVLGVGNGTGSDMLTAWAGSTTGQTIPIRDVKREFKDLKDTTRLQRATTAAFETLRYPIAQMPFKVQLGGDYTTETVQVGSVLRVSTQGDPIIPDGEQTMRVIALSGDLTDTVTPEVQPWQ